MNKNLFVVIGCANVILSSDDTFICEDSTDNRQMFNEEEANKLKEEFDKLYSKGYSYRVAKLTFLD